MRRKKIILAILIVILGVIFRIFLVEIINIPNFEAAIKMYHKLILSEVVSEISHAFDLGAELQKAEIAIKNNLKYTQDRELIL